jgi:hypothetical protein
LCFGDNGKKQIQDTAGSIAQSQEARQNAAYTSALPYWSSRITGGLPYKAQLLDYSGGTTARTAAPQRADLIRRMAMAGIGPNDPAYHQTLADFNANLARGFDQNVTSVLSADELAKQQAAQAFFGVAQANDPLRALGLQASLATA